MKHNPQLLFAGADKVYGELESASERTYKLKELFLAAGMTKEYDDLLKGIHDVLEQFDDFMPGLEMEARGEL